MSLIIITEMNKIYRWNYTDGIIIKNQKFFFTYREKKIKYLNKYFIINT
jgi:hypothetical protein